MRFISDVLLGAIVCSTTLRYFGGRGFKGDDIEYSVANLAVMLWYLIVLIHLGTLFRHRKLTDTICSSSLFIQHAYGLHYLEDIDSSAHQVSFFVNIKDFEYLSA